MLCYVIGKQLLIVGRIIPEMLGLTLAHQVGFVSIVICAIGLGSVIVEAALSGPLCRSPLRHLGSDGGQWAPRGSDFGPVLHESLATGTPLQVGLGVLKGVPTLQHADCCNHPESGSNSVQRSWRSANLRALDVPPADARDAHADAKLLVPTQAPVVKELTKNGIGC